MQIVKQEFIPVAVDADVLNYLEDEDGRFARASGVYLFGSSGGVAFVTASGKQLGKRHGHGTKIEGIKEALQHWNKLPESERRPGGIQLGERGPMDTKRAAVEPPAGGLILKLYGRYLARDAATGLRTTTLAQDFPNTAQPAKAGLFDFYTESNPDFMWLTEAEWKSLIPASPKQGDRYPLPSGIIDRMCWYHLLPNALSARTGNLWPETGAREKKGIRAREVMMTVESVTPSCIRLTLEGFVHLGNAFDPDRPPWKNGKDYVASVGYEAQLRGHLDYDSVKKAFTRFDMIALGDMYGESSENAWLYRPGRNPVGFAFELVSGTVPAERLPPRGNMTPRDLEWYLGTGKPR